MDWLIEDALPPAALATALAPEIAGRAPTFVGWLQTGRLRRVASDPRDTLCTPAEAWQLQRAGYAPAEALPLASGWPALHSQPASDAPVWWALPCHLHVTERGVTLLDPERLQLTSSELAELVAAISADLVEAGITASNEPTHLPWHWRLPQHWQPVAPTPACASGEDIQHWWPQSHGERPWRRLLNLIQMVWHDHPVNMARRELGQLEANSVWLFGGASPAQLAQRPAALAVQRFSELTAAARAGDWHLWLEALAHLEQQHFAAVSTASPTGASSPTLILTGADAWLELAVPRRTGLARWWPARRRDWQAAFFA